MLRPPCSYGRWNNSSLHVQGHRACTLATVPAQDTQPARRVAGTHPVRAEAAQSHNLRSHHLGLVSANGPKNGVQDRGKCSCVLLSYPCLLDTHLLLFIAAPVTSGRNSAPGRSDPLRKGTPTCSPNPKFSFLERWGIVSISWVYKRQPSLSFVCKE